MEKYNYETASTTLTAEGADTKEDEDVEIEEDTEELSAINGNTPMIAKSNKKKKKKKKKPEPTPDTSSTSQAKDELLSSKPLNTCPYYNCKQRLTVTSVTCKYCNVRYCMQHRLPEAHSPDKCAVSSRSAEQARFKMDSNMYLTELQRDPANVSKKGFSVAQAREEAREKLRDKIKNMEGERGKKKEKEKEKNG